MHCSPPSVWRRPAPQYFGYIGPSTYCGGNCLSLYGPGFAQAECFASCEFCAASGGGSCFTSTECEGDPNCFCTATTEHSGFCASGQYCVSLPTCTTSAELSDGLVLLGGHLFRTLRISSDLQPTVLCFPDPASFGGCRRRQPRDELGK